MRLIDADELMALLRVRKNSSIGTDLEEIPTVKAIPIEWIEKHYGWLTMANEIIKDWEKHESRDTESTK